MGDGLVLIGRTLHVDHAQQLLVGAVAVHEKDVPECGVHGCRVARREVWHERTALSEGCIPRDADAVCRVVVDAQPDANGGHRSVRLAGRERTRRLGMRGV